MQYLFTKMPEFDREHEVILGVLAHRGIASSQDLQSATGKSQATVSRLLAGMSSTVLTLGRARATRYALPQLIRGHPAQQPISWTDASGHVRQIGVLSFLAGGRVHIESDWVQVPTAPALPWFLAPVRAQGFLGRLHARRFASAGLDADPAKWDLESILFSALHLHDTAGAITLGDSVLHHPLVHLATGEDGLAAALDEMAARVAESLPAGSSAAGEQPKFLCVLAAGQHALVKFTPPRGTPFGERWHDLLVAECLASQVLEEHGVAVARSRIVRSAARTYLVSERFDRIGVRGRLHAVSIGDVHRGFVPDIYNHWAATAIALARQGRLDKTDADRIAALRAFGLLIGNTDMHSGNCALLVTLQDLAKGRFSLAPVYDMLPMRWRPNPDLGGAPDYTAFELDAAAASGPATGPAREFWARLEAEQDVSRPLRTVAGQMVRRVGGPAGVR